jgi:hypothetical protein
LIVDTLCAESIPAVLPVARPGCLTLWIDRVISPTDLMVGLLAEVTVHGWPKAMVVDAEHNSFSGTGRMRIAPPFWIIKDERVYYGLQLSPKAYDTIRIVRADAGGIEIEAYTGPAAKMLTTISRAPWIAPLRLRGQVIKLLDGRTKG